jgi:hypothetical protein
MSLANLIKQLEQGFCPVELNFNTKADEVIDWEKVRYNTFFKSNEFFENKFPPELQNLPAFDKIIDLIVDKNKENSPLKEMEERGSKSEN